ncbi:hypothetical protein RN001_001326 [Aquatica leii]|uniref:Tyr recombinase domain-containing protein n=1 Tax=Aquatica leii TaxID=1421715 RepID=A0AAN7PBF4_9COLE|nr:hypothetical protein RN001_001326 [Aquatica leii]
MSDFSCTLPEIREIAENAVSNLLPNKSRAQYEKEFNKFQEWCNGNKIKVVSENVMLSYFDIQQKKYKPSTLWSIYSMLKCCLNMYKDVDISKYNKLQALLKRTSAGYAPKKSKILEEEEINKFIQEADDRTYLAMKVILIIGYNGACRREELTNILVQYIEYKSDAIVIHIPKTKNNIPRTFAITNPQWIDLIKSYFNLRPKEVTHNRFF